MSEVKNDNYVGLKVFGIIITILFTLIMGAYTLAGQALSKAGDVDSEQSSMRSDMEWVKQALIRIESKL